MANRIQYRRDTAANWTAANPVLALGEPAWETDTKKRKTGDGTTAWNNLPYQLDKATADTTYTKARNLAAPSYPYWRRALAKARAGIADAKVLAIGDSTVWGYGSGASAPPTAAWAGILPSFITNAFNVPAAIGLANDAAQSGNGIDSRWSNPLPTGWSQESSQNGWAGVCYKAAAGALPLVYTPGTTASYDTFDVYYIATGSSAAFTIQATGGSAVTVTPGTQNGIYKATCTAGSAGSGNAVTITPATSTRIIGVEPYLSTTKKVRVGNAAKSGSTANTWGSTQPYGSIPCIKAYAPDLSIICLGINDSSNATWTANFATNLQAVITAAKVSGDVILVTFVPSYDDGSGIGPNESSILQAYQQLATTNNIGLIDINSRWISYPASNPLGYYFDVLHPSAFGYYDIAEAITDGLKSIR